MRKTKVTRKDVLFVSISMFAIVALWLGLSLYHSWVTSTISDNLQLQIVPIAPNFDTKTLDDLKSRNKIDPIFEAAIEVTASPAAQITPTITSDSETLDEEEISVPTEESSPTEIPTPAL